MNSFLGIVAADRAFGNSAGHCAAGESHSQQCEREECGDREGQETGRSETKRREQAHPAKNDAQAPDEIGAETALRVKDFEAIFQREQQSRVIDIEKLNSEQTVFIEEIWRDLDFVKSIGCEARFFSLIK